MLKSWLHAAANINYVQISCVVTIDMGEEHVKQLLDLIIVSSITNSIRARTHFGIALDLRLLPEKMVAVLQKL